MEPAVVNENQKTTGPASSPHSSHRWGDGGQSGEVTRPGTEGHPGVLSLQLGWGRQELSLVLSDVFWMVVNKMALKGPSLLFTLPPGAGWKQSGA